MKLTHLICLLAFGLSHSLLKAQEEIEAPLQQQNIDTDEKTKTKIGVKFTMGMHTFRGNAFDKEKPLYGFGAGVYNIVHLNPSKSLNIQWELNMDFKGSKFSNSKDTTFNYSKISLAYLDLPIYFSMQLNQNERPYHLLMGGQVGYLFRSSINKSYGQFGEVKTNLPFKPIDIMPAIGIRKDIGNGLYWQLCIKYDGSNIHTNTFHERATLGDPIFIKDYRDFKPLFKDGSHWVKNIGIEYSLLF